MKLWIKRRRVKAGSGKLGDVKVALASTTANPSGSRPKRLVWKRGLNYPRLFSKGAAEETLRQSASIRWHSAQTAVMAGSVRRHIIDDWRDYEERAQQDLEALQKDGVKVVWPRSCKEKTHECPRPVNAAAQSIGKESRELQDDQDMLQELMELEQAGLKVAWPRRWK